MCGWTLRLVFALVLGLAVASPTGSAAGEPAVKTIVLLAGKKSHGPGAHEYEKDAKLLKHCLNTSANVKGVKSEAHFNGWPADPATLDSADTIVLLSDGLDKQYPIEQHPFLKGDRLAVVERQLQRGCGLVLIHWPLWAPGKVGREKFMPWLGGFCDYESPPAPGMSDKVDWSRQSKHPICRGLAPFTFQDEYYGNVRFLGTDPRFTPILPFPGKPKQPVWAWAWLRDDGGRSFAFIGGHSHANWRIEMLRKAILNAILWTAKAEIPVGGAISMIEPKSASARFGRALDAADETAVVEADPAWVGPRLSVECWVCLNSKSGFNILVSSEPKSSGTHWEIYSYAGTGFFSAYLPGYGGEVKSACDITDGQWRHVAMLFEPQQVRLYVDGAEVARQAIARNIAMKPQPGPLAIGLAYSGDQRIGCDGLIDEVRISCGLRKIDGVPAGPFAADKDTLGLWHFDDDPRKLSRQDSSGNKRHAELRLKPD